MPTPSPFPTPQQMTLATIEAARADLASDTEIIRAAVADLPTGSVRTTVRIEIPGGVKLSGGEQLTSVMVHRTVYPTTSPRNPVVTRQMAEGLVGGEWFRLPVALVDELISRAEQQ